MSDRGLYVQAGMMPGGTPYIDALGMARGAYERLSRGPEAWAKGDFFVGGGECALGAIRKVTVDRAVLAEEFDKLQNLLLENLKAIHPALTATTIPDLNDDPTVTYEGVLVAFEKTVLQLEEAV